MLNSSQAVDECLDIDFSGSPDLLAFLSDRAKAAGMEVPEYTRLVICSYLSKYKGVEPYDGSRNRVV